MRLRYKSPRTGNYVTGRGSQLNVHAPFEVIMYFDDAEGCGGCDSMPGSDLDVLIGEDWMPLGQAFRERKVITDNENTCFFEPANEAERERGYR